MPIPAGFFSEIEASSFKDRLNALQNLHKSLPFHSPLPSSTESSALNGALIKVVTADSNVQCVGVAVECLALLARAPKYAYAMCDMRALLAKLKDKKLHAKLRKAVHDIVAGRPLLQFVDVIVESLVKVNPAIRAQTALFIGDELIARPSIGLPLGKALLPAFIRLLFDADKTCREMAAVVIAALQVQLGEAFVTAGLADVKDAAKKKLVEVALAEVNARRIAALPPPPAAAVLPPAHVVVQPPTNAVIAPPPKESATIATQTAFLVMATPMSTQTSVNTSSAQSQTSPIREAPITCNCRTIAAEVKSRSQLSRVDSAASINDSFTTAASVLSPPDDRVIPLPDMQITHADDPDMLTPRAGVMYDSPANVGIRPTTWHAPPPLSPFSTLVAKETKSARLSLLDLNEPMDANCLVSPPCNDRLQVEAGARWPSPNRAKPASPQHMPVINRTVEIDRVRQQVESVVAPLSPRPTPIAALRQPPIVRTPTHIEPALLPGENGSNSTPNATVLHSPEDGAAPFTRRPPSPVTMVVNRASTMDMSTDSSNMKTKGLASRTFSALKKKVKLSTSKTPSKENSSAALPPLGPSASVRGRAPSPASFRSQSSRIVARQPSIKREPVALNIVKRPPSESSSRPPSGYGSRPESSMSGRPMSRQPSTSSVASSGYGRMETDRSGRSAMPRPQSMLRMPRATSTVRMAPIQKK